MVYGALPPETRRLQAKLFNEQNNGYDVLVASDAIGMGLNLNIRRVIFHKMHKYTGNKDSALDPVPATQVIAYTMHPTRTKLEVSPAYNAASAPWSPTPSLHRSISLGIEQLVWSANDARARPPPTVLNVKSPIHY